ncbi:hypothetical protein BGW39_002409 [Mortierella sp. 14UC]|nr:hypothetical protein BGW39_002409 [Mortierella sp. 14UC]
MRQAGALAAGVGSSIKWKLVETHMVKVAKVYVPAQAEESHANDNHLKGYYEDYEDARTTKSLSMYKLGMRIPETALTIQDRDLFNVDYMFVIKFFFKGRMGAFLELPIEIVSQYNHNRISTISGTISRVSNSVQIALPPVPILVKRHDSVASSSGSASSASSAAANQDAADGGAIRQAIEDSAKNSLEDDERSEELKDGGIRVTASDFQGADEIQTSSTGHKNVKATTVISSDSSVSTTGIILKGTSQGSCFTAQDTSATVDRSSTIGVGSEGEENTPNAKDKKDSEPSGGSTDTQKKEEDGILASSRPSKVKFEACTNRQVGLTVALYNKMSSTVGKGAAPVTTPAASIKDSRKSKPASIVLGVADGVPKIIVESFKQPKSGIHDFASSSSTSTSSSNSSTRITTTITTVVSPALPILFDLTSAALPTPVPSTVSPSIPTPLVIPRTSGDLTTTVMTPSLRSSSMGAGITRTVTSTPVADIITHSNSFPRSVKDNELHLPKLQPLRQGTTTSIYSTYSREDDHHGHHQYGYHPETEGSKSGSIVAKIAKSLSSLLLRSRAGSISPSGSQANLSIVSPQQQSSAFTLAATTLSALTLLSSVGQAAVSSEGKKMQPSIPLVFQLPARPLKACIKKRPASTRPPGLNTGNLNAAGGGGQYGRGLPSVTSAGGQQGRQHSYSSTSTNRKKVAIAKGLTPVPSPNGSQIMLTESIVLKPFKYKNNYPNSVSSSSTSTSIGMNTNSSLTTACPSLVPSLASSVRSNPAVTAAATPMAIAWPLVSTLNQQQHHHMQQQKQQNMVASYLAKPQPSTPAAITPTTIGMTTRSPNSTGPRERMHRPSTATPKHLDFQIQDLKSSRSHGSATKGVSFKGAAGSDDDEEEEEEGYEEAEDEEEEEEKQEEDDQETEEERIERRRQVRIAWLAKYGDAFKQVYGAVPELPPL